MALYFANTEITGVKDLFPLSSKDITNVYFADTELFTVWGTYDGALPAQYASNGDYLAEYRIYGASGGVGDRTENLFDKSKHDSRTNVTLNAQGQAVEQVSDNSWTISDYISISSEIPTYIASGLSKGGTGTYCCVYDSQKNFLRSIQMYANQNVTINTQNGDAFVRLSVRMINNEIETAMLTEGSTAPSEYVPYGYEVDMGVKSVNLFDYSDLETGSISASDGTNVNNAAQKRTEHYIDVNPSSQYILRNAQGGIRVHEYTVSNVWIRSVLIPNNTVFVSSNNTAKIRLAAYAESFTIQMIICQFFITTPIYVGDTQLGEDEYVSFKEQKIYRRPNLYDANATDTSKGYLANSYLYGNTIGSNPNWFVSEYMPILADTDYIASGLVDVGALGVIATINIYNSNKQLERYETINSSGDTEINSGVNGAFIRISARNEHKNTVVVKPKNATPTDPPVPLPALPTVDGTNIVDYAGQSAAVPSRFVAKYRKEGFK